MTVRDRSLTIISPGGTPSGLQSLGKAAAKRPQTPHCSTEKALLHQLKYNYQAPPVPPRKAHELFCLPPTVSFTFTRAFEGNPLVIGYGVHSMNI